MNCWVFLDLPEDAGERAIRRRYAQLLKVHRPDEDPAAFQRLREAYERALQLARWRAEEAAQDGDDAGDEIPGTSQFESQVVPVPSVNARLLDDEEPLAASPPENPALPGHWFESAEPELLQAALEAAEAEGQRDLFERTLLQHCLSGSPLAPGMTRWALQELHWFDLGQRVELPLSWLDALASRLIDAAVDELGDDLRAGRERMFVECLKMLMDDVWLQSFDRRALFRQRLADLLLETPRWSDALFGAVCELCSWDESRFEQPWQWQELVRRAEESAFALRLRGFLELSQPSTAEQKAAWLLLKPMDEDARRRMAVSLRREEAQACGWLADTLRHRYPRLLEEFGASDIETWRAIAHYWAGSARPAEPQAPYEEPDKKDRAWRYTAYTCWLVLACGVLLNGASRPSVRAWGDYIGHWQIVAGALVMAGIFTGAGMVLVRIWRWLLIELGAVDPWLSRILMPRKWNAGGLRILGHLAPSALLSALLGVWGQTPELGAAPLGVLVFILCGTYCVLAVRGEPPERQLWRGVAYLFRRSAKYSLVILSVLVIVGVLKIMSDFSPAQPPPPQTVCGSEECQRWSTVKGSLLELARAKRAAEEEAHLREAGAAPQSRF